MEGAIASGLGAIAICDHNSAEAIDSVREAAVDSGLCVFPGTELTVRGGHLLAIFDLDTPVVILRRLLADMGFNQEHRGNGYLGVSAWMDEAARMVVEAGGLAIAAHADRYPRGFLASEEATADKKRIHESPYLSALEITNPADKALWNEGKSPVYPKKYACLQGSDAHSPGEIGRRWTAIDMPSLTLAGLRLALADYRRRVRLPGESM
ncbi:MAG: hypothetical protein HYX92_10960 [Chloroflexi bacterium]|nr:hypothetical protein [Chloroflexota bacterium]